MDLAIRNMGDEEMLGWAQQFLEGQENLSRPTLDEYFLMMAFMVALRSEDKFVKHGAVIVENSSHHVLATGFNGTFKGSDKTKIPVLDRDARRPWMIHAEENAIMNCSKNPLSLHGGASIYVTGVPCVQCLQRLVTFGINRICIAPRGGTMTDNEQTAAMKEQILHDSGVIIHQMESIGWLELMMRFFDLVCHF